MRKKLIPRHLTGNRVTKFLSDVYEDANKSSWIMPVYDTVNMGLYAAAPFTGGVTLPFAMGMTGLLAGLASANMYEKGSNSNNVLDVASAAPGFGITTKLVKSSAKPVMGLFGKSTKFTRIALKYIPKEIKISSTTQRRIHHGGRNRYVLETINSSKNSPTFYLLAKRDKKYIPYATMVYGEDALNHGLNITQSINNFKEE